MTFNGYYDESKANAELKELSSDARYHLQHVYRNHLQTIIGSCDMALDCDGISVEVKKHISIIKDQIYQISHSLNQMGL